MNKIYEKKWKKFKLGDLFDLKNSKAYHTKDVEETDAGLHYITRSKFNNGLKSCVVKIDDYQINPAGTISFGAENANFFYQENEYITGNKMYYIDTRNISKYSALFLRSVLEETFTNNFSFSDGMIPDRIKDEYIYLPQDSNEQPDWEYMESYMKNIMQESEKNIENLQNISDYKNKVDINKWQEYRLGDLFYKCNLNKKANFKKISDVSLEKTDEFDLPLVNAKHYNNGIMYYGRSSDFDSEIMTLDIVQNGAAAVGDVYAQPQRTGVLEDAYLIKAYDNITSADVLQFLATVIQKDIKQHFSYDDKCTWDKAKEMLIHLPANPNGKPDWKYMESFMKNIMEDTQSKLDKLVCC